MEAERGTLIPVEEAFQEEPKKVAEQQLEVRSSQAVVVVPGSSPGRLT